MAAARSEKIGYGLGDMSSSMFWKIFSYYLPFFYSNIFGLSLEHAAVLLLVTKLWDAVSDPVMGLIADRTTSRWGRYRPYLLWVAVPFAVAGILTFTTPTWSYSAKLIWAYATYLLMMTVYTAINVPYGAMLGVVTDDSRERTVFSSYRMFFAYGGSFLALAIFEPLCDLFTPDTGDMDAARAVAAQADGWQAAMIVVGTICALLFLLCFRLTRERVAPVESPSAGGQSILSDMKSLAGNGPWWILLGVAVAALLFNSIRGGAAAYYFKDFIGEDNLLGGSMILSCGAFLAIGEIANMLGVVLAVPISLRIGKRMTYIWAMAVSGLLSIVFFFMPATVAGCWAMVVLQIVISAAAGITFPLLWSMYADVADYSELKHGHGSTGLIFSSSSMAQKFGGAFGSALILWLLASYGYDTSGAAVQNGEAIFGLRMLMSWAAGGRVRAGRAAGCNLSAQRNPHKRNRRKTGPAQGRKQMNMNREQQFKRELTEELRNNILPFWARQMVDPGGGFFGRMTGTGELIANAGRSAILCGRILWTFSAAYRTSGCEQYLATATAARDYLLDKFLDKTYGGVYWSVDAAGNPADTKKQFYALGFAIYGLSEYARATGDERALREAIGLFRAIEEHSYDAVNNGYEEAAARDWSPIDDVRLSDKDANEKKTMNTHLHILEAYTNLLRIWPDEGLRRQTRNLLEIFLSRIVQPQNGHLGLFFDDRWQLKSAGCFSYGHDIEASWLLLETAATLGDEALYERTRTSCYAIANAALEGYMGDWSMIYERHPDGTRNLERHWWVQAECVIGLFYLYRLHGRKEALEPALKTWDYIKTHLIDRTGGEWWWSILPDGSVNRTDDKAGFWKCPYHNGRMCMEIAAHIPDNETSSAR